MSDTVDPRLHGPATCPVAPRGCETCRGSHHWIEASVDPGADPNDPDPNLSPADRAVLVHDRQHGTEHALAYYGCKHCDAWAEPEYVWDEEDLIDECDEDWIEDLEPCCGGTGFLHCECGGDFCACGMQMVECPGCCDCEDDGEDTDEDTQ